MTAGIGGPMTSGMCTRNERCSTPPASLTEIVWLAKPVYCCGGTVGPGTTWADARCVLRLATSDVVANAAALVASNRRRVKAFAIGSSICPLWRLPLPDATPPGSRLADAFGSLVAARGLVQRGAAAQLTRGFQSLNSPSGLNSQIQACSS